MKILPILEMTRDQRGKKKPMAIKRYGKEPYDPAKPNDYFYEYYFSYDVNGGDFISESIEAHKKTDYEDFKDVWFGIADNNGIDKANQKMIKNGDDAVWMGYTMGEIESKTDEDEDGRYEYVEGLGEGWVVSTKALDDAQVSQFADQLEKALDKDAAEAVEAAVEARKDSEEYARDPYAYYGLSRKDFM